MKLAAAWAVAVALAIVVGLYGVSVAEPIDPDGDGVIVNGFVLHDVTPAPVAIVRDLAGVAILVLLVRVNVRNYAARIAREAR